MEKRIKEVNPGNIYLAGKVIVSDPCYDRSAWCNAKDITVTPGWYYATILADEKRVRCIIVVHCDFLRSMPADFKLESGTIWVGSGQCGIFDDAIYPSDKKSIGGYDDHDTFYGECSKITLGEKLGGILENQRGIVSPGGISNGVYELYCQYHDGERIALLLNFNRCLKVEDINSGCIKIKNSRKNI